MNIHKFSLIVCPADLTPFSDQSVLMTSVRFIEEEKTIEDWFFLSDSQNLILFPKNFSRISLFIGTEGCISSFKSLYILSKAFNMIINICTKHLFFGIQVSKACINMINKKHSRLCRLFARPFSQILYFLEILLCWILLQITYFSLQSYVFCEGSALFPIEDLQ